MSFKYRSIWKNFIVKIFILEAFLHDQIFFEKFLLVQRENKLRMYLIISL